MKRILHSFAAAAFLATALISCGGETTAPETEPETTTVAAPELPATVVTIATGSADHSTLVAAVTAAGLVETLSGEGPFTVFAPTNAAFEALPAGTVENLLKPENKGDLTAVLTYHVVAGKLKAADLQDGQKLKTVNGAELTVSIKEGVVSIDGATVTAADLEAGNGVVHVLNAVVLPKN
ncbi:MAG TPA: fasciclin domain-containing protein [Lacibacter sp.]|nr:fasciclin domain-containing protein [Lacibacter sp.]HMO89416.1 fasciclin domain-containing protein [Lacibacter sp.]HMP86346.1 fasciclin domain-containing protein [Lacibacter sp.]